MTSTKFGSKKCCDFSILSFCWTLDGLTWQRVSYSYQSIGQSVRQFKMCVERKLYPTSRTQSLKIIGFYIISLTYFALLFHSLTVLLIIKTSNISSMDPTSTRSPPQPSLALGRFLIIQFRELPARWPRRILVCLGQSNKCTGQRKKRNKLSMVVHHFIGN